MIQRFFMNSGKKIQSDRTKDMKYFPIDPIHDVAKVDRFLQCGSIGNFLIFCQMQLTSVSPMAGERLTLLELVSSASAYHVTLKPK